jgi:hypothetical protein
MNVQPASRLPAPGATGFANSALQPKRTSRMAELDVRLKRKMS